MGGHAAGDVASRLAVDSFSLTFVDARRKGASIEEALRHSLETTNDEIAAKQAASPEATGMGTTLVVAHVSAKGVAWISVGDSPLWLFRDGKLLRLNEDHSLRAAVADGAKLSGNILQSAVNGDPIALVDCRAEPLPLRIGDVVVLASDGVLTLKDQEIAGVARKSSVNGPDAVAQALLQAVETRGKANQDNCAVLIASMGRKKSGL